MPISNELLEILCCPKSKVAVKMVPEADLTAMNARIEQGGINYEDGTAVDKPLQEALITEDGKTLYRVDDNIPVMLIERGIVAEQLGD